MKNKTFKKHLWPDQETLLTETPRSAANEDFKLAIEASRQLEIEYQKNLIDSLIYKFASGNTDQYDFNHSS